MANIIKKRFIVPSPERWLSVEEIAIHLGVSKETIYRRVDKKKIPAHKVGRQWKFKVSEVDNWVTTGGGADSPLEITRG